MVQAAEDEVAEMAREAARADAVARAARKATAKGGEQQELQLQRLKVRPGAWRLARAVCCMLPRPPLECSWVGRLPGSRHPPATGNRPAPPPAPG